MNRENGTKLDAAGQDALKALDAAGGSATSQEASVPMSSAPAWHQCTWSRAWPAMRCARVSCYNESAPSKDHGDDPLSCALTLHHAAQLPACCACSPAAGKRGSLPPASALEALDGALLAACDQLEPFTRQGERR